MKNNLAYQIREAKPEQDQRLREIGLTCYCTEIDPDRRYWLVHLMFRRYFSHRHFMQRREKKVMIFSLEKDGEIWGFYELERSGLLSSLYVHPQAQKKGYGKALLEDAKKKAKVHHILELHLDASVYAEAFYLHQGFQKSGLERKVFGITMIPMKAKIS